MILRKLLLTVLLLPAVLPSQAKDFEVKGGGLILVVDSAVHPIVGSAVAMFCADWHAVFGTEPTVTDDMARASDDRPRIVAAIAGSHLPDGVILSDSLTSHREAYEIAVMPSGCLVVSGSDAHGTAYGLMELSRLIGVSPWEWWADAYPTPRSSFRIEEGFRQMRHPSVDYRGIFINDEEWGFTPWSCHTHEPGEEGSVGPKTTERIFQLLLRLRANTYWPPMHSCTRPFFLTHGNRDVARRYGIYIGSSHCEPMGCNANGEWVLRGVGEYNFKDNRDNVMAFWRQRTSEMANQEVIYTMGMRGIHDSGILGARNAAERRQLTEAVLKEQRNLIREVYGSENAVPQVFIPYKEVLDIYRDGMEIPDDMTLMWCDDNYGYLRHLPTDTERTRSGGNGLYYHSSYWGRPHDYLWLGTFSPSLMMQQLLTAYDNGIRRMWILNVGDIKPLEYQTELFMDMAWDIETVRQMGAKGHLNSFLVREFDEQAASRLTPLMMEHYKLAFIRKPEFMGNTRTEEKDPSYKVVRDMPWTDSYALRRMESYKEIHAAAATEQEHLQQRRHDAYFHLIGYPLMCAAQMNIKMLAAQLTRHGLDYAADIQTAADSIEAMTARYNNTNGGKWRGMMDSKPRRLPIFMFDGQGADTTRTPSDPDQHPVFVIDALDMEGATPNNLALGYNGKAAEITKGQELSWTFDSRWMAEKGIAADTLHLLLCFIPTHPSADGVGLIVRTTIDGVADVTTDHATEGRSEEWKQNVLRNRAIRRAALPLNRGDKHTLTVEALTDGVVLDQVIIL